MGKSSGSSTEQFCSLKPDIYLCGAAFLTIVKTIGVIKPTSMSYKNDKLNMIHVFKTEAPFKKQNAVQLRWFKW